MQGEWLEADEKEIIKKSEKSSLLMEIISNTTLFLYYSNNASVKYVHRKIMSQFYV